MSSHVMTYLRIPCTNLSTVSRATTCPGCSAFKSFGLRSIFLRFLRSIFPLPFVRSGKVRRPPLSLMIRPMVTGFGHERLNGVQNSRSKGYTFFSPRFGYVVRSRLISSTIRQSYLRCRFLFGAREPQFRLSSFPLPALSFFCHPYSVRFFTPYASSAASSPCFFQNVNIFALFFASSLIIYANRIAYSCIVRDPFTPRLMLNIRMLLSD